MSLILNIETSTKNCSVALSNQDNIVDVLEYAEAGYSHAEKLHVFIEQILSDNDISLQDLAAISVSKGPGSYTGLRIGVSTAKALAYALQIPLISVSTLMHLGYKIKEKAYIIPMIDARRMEVYSMVLDKNHKTIRDIQAEIIDKTSFREFLDKEKVYFLGDAVPKIKEVINHPNAVFTDYLYPSAKEMAKFSYEKFLAKDFEDVAYFEPFYLKDFIAVKKR